MVNALYIVVCIIASAGGAWLILVNERRARAFHRDLDRRRAEYDAESLIRLATVVQAQPWLHGVRSWDEARERAMAQLAALDQKRGKA